MTAPSAGSLPTNELCAQAGLAAPTKATNVSKMPALT